MQDRHDSGEYLLQCATGEHAALCATDHKIMAKFKNYDCVANSEHSYHTIQFWCIINIMQTKPERKTA